MYKVNNNKFNLDLPKAEIAKLKNLGQVVKCERLNAFDEASVDFINQYQDAMAISAFRDQIKRICELAGINSELAQQRWWKKYYARKMIKAKHS